MGKIARGSRLGSWIGTFAVQIARSSGPQVTGVTCTRNIDLVRSLGADHAVDDTTTDFVGSGRRYDFILDTVGNRSVLELRRALSEGGKASSPDSPAWGS
jgi:NADPH:quinone reductase-like Zn-dependent oxidoreductase